MAEMRYPIAEAMETGHAPAAGGGDITLAEIRLGTIVQLATFAGRRDDLFAALAGIRPGLEPAPACRGHDLGDAALLTVGPARWLVVADDPDLAAALAQAVAAETAAVTDLSHARAIVRISGPGAARLMQDAVAVDLDPVINGPGAVIQTPVHHFNALVHRRRDDVFDVYAMRSFAGPLYHWATDAAAPVGYTIGAAAGLKVGD
ncbi:MAG: hypothetical protein GY791_00575 [Alphaproteobacteria bacterium]|nr:hypothetical protein [Alphaproteobacteria bacterium]